VKKRFKPKPRPGTVCALVAWILIVPPQLGDSGHPAKAVPYSKWEQMGIYNSEAECNADRETFIKQDQKEYKLSLGSSTSPPPSDLAPAHPISTTLKSTRALCVSDDDPRMKN